MRLIEHGSVEDTKLSTNKQHTLSDIINSDFRLQIDNLETPEGRQTRTLGIIDNV
jgi:hypothetical protein